MNAQECILAAHIRAAAKEAQKYSDVDDGGTCNLDSAYVRAKGMREGTRRKLEIASGVGLTLSSSRWHGRMLTLHCYNGQGARRTKQAEVAYKSLKDAGVDAGIWYQMD